MTPLVINTAKCREEDVALCMRKPSFRKATRGMTYAYGAVAALLDRYPALLSQLPPSRIGIVVSSSHGELEVTKEFLKGIGSGQKARPILFQNSLHNSVLGFLTVELGISGVCLTLSNGWFSGEDVMDMCQFLISEGDCDVCMGVAYDMLVPELEGVRDQFYPKNLIRGEGAAAVLCAEEKIAKKLGLPAKAALVDIECYRRGTGAGLGQEPPRLADGYYDSDGLVKFHDALSDPDRNHEELILFKPHGQFSKIIYKRL